MTISTNMHIMKIALVTGASSGIGRALVKELLDQNYQVIGLSRSVISEDQNDNLQTFVCDVCDLKAVESLKEHIPVPDFFFLNAGIAGEGAIEPVDSLDLDHHRKMLETNYFGVLNFVHTWLKPCIEKGGATFVVTSSINAVFAPPGGSAYAGSKAAISKAFDGLRLAHRDQGVHFQSVFCGPVDTPGLAGNVPFTWTAEKMASYMVKRAKEGSGHVNPSKFYASLSRVFNWLPDRWVLKILNKGK